MVFYVINQPARKHGDMFREGVSGDDGPPPESKRPPDDLNSCKEVLEKVGVSTALSTAFKNVYSAGVNAVSAKSFQQAFARPILNAKSLFVKIIFEMPFLLFGAVLLFLLSVILFGGVSVRFSLSVFSLCVFVSPASYSIYPRSIHTRFIQEDEACKISDMIIRYERNVCVCSFRRWRRIIANYVGKPPTTFC
jgi:hypothetical protein